MTGRGWAVPSWAQRRLPELCRGRALRVLFLTAATIGVASVYGVCEAQASSATLQLVPSQSTVSVGSDVTLQVTFSSTGSADAVAAILTYPQQLLEYRELSVSDSWPITAATSGGGGRVTIEAGTTTPVTGTALVATVKFKALGNGVASVAFAPESVALLAGESLALMTSGTNLTLGTGGAPASASKKPSLRVGVSGLPTIGQIGETANVTIAVSNGADAAGSSNAHALVSVGAGLRIAGVQPPAGRTCTTTSMVDCGVGDLAPGQSVALVVTIRLDAVGSWQLVAHLEQEGQDANPSDDSGSLGITVRSKEAGGAPPGAPPITAPASPKSKPPTVFVAALVKVTKVDDGKRRFALTFVVNRQSSTNIQIVARTKKTVISKRFMLSKGRTVLVVQAPPRASPGWYRLKIKIASTDGAIRILNRPVRIAA